MEGTNFIALAVLNAAVILPAAFFGAHVIFSGVDEDKRGASIIRGLTGQRPLASRVSTLS